MQMKPNVISGCCGLLISLICLVRAWNFSVHVGSSRPRFIMTDRSSHCIFIVVVTVHLTLQGVQLSNIAQKHKSAWMGFRRLRSSQSCVFSWVLTLLAYVSGRCCKT